MTLHLEHKRRVFKLKTSGATTTPKMPLRSTEVPVVLDHHRHLQGRLLREQLQKLPLPLLSLPLIVVRRPCHHVSVQ